jgi:hypothetical protein
VNAEAGLIRTDPVAMGVWQRLTKLFATWKMIVFAGFSRRALHQFANDQMTPLVKATHWKIGLGLLGGLTDAQVDFLAVYADLNARKADRIFRTVTLALVTIPVAAVFGISEMDPEFWVRMGFEQVDTILVILGLWLTSSAAMMAAAWRARDLADLLEFEKARRALAAAK